ncbi:MAG: phosphohydrolase [Lachnospiraceae bacterium]|nr:phosphohydrolase [Lachnospiraceae bacterium]
MLFVKISDLKDGMRLARPIYNKNGVLLYERNSKLSMQSIMSIKNFGLLGIFVLEPAEPVPPMTADDIAFERFQTMTVFSLQEELMKMMQTKKAPKIQVIAANVIRNYGNLSRKINFIQNLRSKEDYVYKHNLNVAILCAMITHVMNVKLEEQLDAVLAALVHDVGKLMLTHVDPSIKDFEDLSFVKGIELIDYVFSSNNGIKRCCMQGHKVLSNFHKGKTQENKITTSAKVLAVAETFDMMTAMRLTGEPSSEVKAIKLLLENPEVFDERVVEALIQSINILNPGTCIELNTGEKGLVLAGNEFNILRPMVLGFNDNVILDLSNELAYGDIEIVDIMKTMDNRYIMDTELLKRQGIQFEEPEYVEVPEAEEEYIPGR